VKELTSTLLEQSHRLQKQQEEEMSKSTSSTLQRSDSTASWRSGFGGEGRALVSTRYQREKIQEVMKSVDREAAIIDAVMGRLEKLQV
jgi:hypothetical protein